MAMTIVERTRAVTGGVDTHLDVHVAAALDEIGGLLGVESFEASAAGNDKAIRALVVAKRSGRSTKIKTLNQIRHLGFTAPDELRERLRGVSRQQLAPEAAALRPRPGGDPVTYATKTALRTLGRRVLAL